MSIQDPPEGSEYGSNALGPDVRLLPDGRVAWHLPHPGVPAGDLEWLSTWQAHEGHPHRPHWFRAEELPLAETQRMVPVGPLLELVARWREIRDRCRVGGDELIATLFAEHADLLASLLGGSPESHAQEGEQ